MSHDWATWSEEQPGILSRRIGRIEQRIYLGAWNRAVQAYYEHRQPADVNGADVYRVGVAPLRVMKADNIDKRSA